MTNPTGHLAPFPASARPLRALRMHGPYPFHYGTEVALGDGTSALHICWTREIWMKDNTPDVAVSMAWSAIVGPVEEEGERARDR